MNEVKKIINTIMFVTGTVLVILSVFSLVFGVEIPFVPTIFEIFAANIVIVLGIFLRGRFEIRNIILEYLADISYIIAVLVVFGLIFNWYHAVPVWLLIAMAVVVYTLVMIFTVSKLKKDVEELNELLHKHQEKKSGTAS